MSSEYNEVSKPKHYQLDLPIGKETYEVRDVINTYLDKIVSENDDGIAIEHLYEFANAVKYLLRAPFKDNLKIDLEKSVFCIQTIIDEL